MNGSVYTEEHFTVIDLVMNEPFGWHPDSPFLLPHTPQCQLKVFLNSHYVHSYVMQFDYNMYGNGLEVYNGELIWQAATYISLLYITVNTLQVVYGRH